VTTNMRKVIARINRQAKRSQRLSHKVDQELQKERRCGKCPGGYDTQYNRELKMWKWLDFIVRKAVRKYGDFVMRSPYGGHPIGAAEYCHEDNKRVFTWNNVDEKIVRFDP